MRVRGMLLAALAYFILPFDIIPDMIAGLGFADDAALLTAVIGLVAAHITPTHRAAAARALDKELPPKRLERLNGACQRCGLTITLPVTLRALDEGRAPWPSRSARSSHGHAGEIFPLFAPVEQLHHVGAMLLRDRARRTRSRTLRSWRTP